MRLPSFFNKAKYQKKYIQLISTSTQLLQVSLQMAIISSIYLDNMVKYILFYLRIIELNLDQVSLLKSLLFTFVILSSIIPKLVVQDLLDQLSSLQDMIKIMDSNFIQLILQEIMQVGKLLQLEPIM